MRQKLFNNKEIEPKCIYCAVGTPSPDGESVVCVRYGVMLPDSRCRAFEYDALKRNPPKKARLPEFSESDFSLDLDKID
jgi:hypothetical protein